MTYPHCRTCGELLMLPDKDRIQSCPNGCAPRLRPSVEETHTDEITGTGYDMPEFPATMLIDDINEVVIENVALRLGLDHWSYILYRYPPSHHMV